jgi:putative MATE family efflux protein
MADTRAIFSCNSITFARQLRNAVKPNISYNRIWSIAYPIILGSVAQNLINVTDTAFLGRVGEVALGASALGGMFYMVLIMLGMGFGTGAQIIIARRFGEGKNDQIGKTFVHAFYFMLPLAVVAFFTLLLFGNQILRPLVSSDAIYEASVRFVDYRLYGLFFAFGQILFRSFYIGIARTQIITWSTLVMAIVNIALDYALIFGNWGFPEMGIEGAALASVIAEGIALVFLFINTQYRKHPANFQLYQFGIWDKDLFIRLFKLSGPIMLQNFLSLSVWFAFFLLVEKLGEQALAISNIIRSVYVVLMIPIWGFASASNSLVSYLIGMQYPQLIFKLIKRILVLCVGGVIMLIVFSIFFPQAILSIYTNNPELITNSIPVLQVVNTSAIALAFGFVLFNGVLGTGKTNISFFIELLVLSFYIFYVYMLIRYFNANVALVWTAEIIYGLMLSLLSWIYLKKGKWLSSGV